jgi:hypothetical protein
MALIEWLRAGTLAAIHETGWYLILKVCDRPLLGVGSS